MMTPAASARARSTKSKYGKKTFLITVGAEKEPFHVHVSHLERTAFFDVHGRPPGMDLASASMSPATTPSTVRDQTLSPVPVKMEDPTDTFGTPGSDQQPMDDLAAPPVVYHLKGIGHEPAAFEVFVNWLYNQPPGTPLSRTHCKTLLRAYILAVWYKVDDLQDAIIDCIRQYHKNFNIVFEDLVWMINRFGESDVLLNVPMVKYLIDQCAWEIYSQGYRSFARHNVLFEDFLTMGDRPVRKVLFEAIADVSRNTMVDPATGPNRYKVNEARLFEHTPERTKEVIELDD